jgi:hypothetical protein
VKTNYLFNYSGPLFRWKQELARSLFVFLFSKIEARKLFNLSLMFWYLDSCTIYIPSYPPKVASLRRQPAWSLASLRSYDDDSYPSSFQFANRNTCYKMLNSCPHFCYLEPCMHFLFCLLQFLVLVNNLFPRHTLTTGMLVYADGRLPSA